MEKILSIFVAFLILFLIITRDLSLKRKQRVDCEFLLGFLLISIEECEQNGINKNMEREMILQFMQQNKIKAPKGIAADWIPESMRE